MRRPVLQAVLAALLVGACGATAAPPTPTAAPALPAGTYTSVRFQPAVTYTLPDGWDNPSDSAAYFQVRPAGSEVAGIHLFRDPAAASQAADCPTSAEPGVGGSSIALVAWIRERPGLVVSSPALVEVGGLRGTMIDVGIASGWTESCPFASGLPTVPLFNGTTAAYHWIVVGNERLRLHILDVPGGGTVVVDVDAFDGTLIEALLQAASPIVKSLRFATP